MIGDALLVRGVRVEEIASLARGPTLLPPGLECEGSNSPTLPIRKTLKPLPGGRRDASRVPGDRTHFTAARNPFADDIGGDVAEKTVRLDVKRQDNPNSAGKSLNSAGNLA